MSLTNTYNKVIITVGCIMLVGSLGMCAYHKFFKGTKDTKSTQKALSVQTTVLTHDKQKEHADINVKQKFIVKVNGKEQELVLKETEGVTLTQTIDLTPIAEALRPTWELGAGAGVTHNKFTGAVAVQRNYNKNTGVEVLVTRDSSKYGVLVMYKKLIK